MVGVKNLGITNGQSKFLQVVRQQVPDIYPIRNTRSLTAEWSGLSLHNGKPVKLYFDLNANNKLEPDEAINPIADNQDHVRYQEFRFVTPDFTIPSSGAQTRLMLVVDITYQSR